MTLLEYWQASGKTSHIRKRELANLAEQCGTTHEYLKHIARGRKRPGVNLAYRLIKASGGKLTLVELLQPK